MSLDQVRRTTDDYVDEPRYVYCLVYELAGDRVRDMRCYGSIAGLMAM